MHASDNTEEKKKAPQVSTTTAIITDSESHCKVTLKPCTATQVGEENQQSKASSANNTATSSTIMVRAAMQPRQTEPGAVRVAGLDGENSDDDDDSMINTAVASDSVDPNNPVSAEVFDEDEENQRIQEKIDREVAAQREREHMERQEDIPEAEIVMEKSHCSTRVKIWSGVAVVLLVIAAIALGTVLPRVLQEPAEPAEPPTPSPQEVQNELERFLIGSFIR